MNVNNKMERFIVNKELYNLLTTLRDTKEIYRIICAKMRKKGVKLGKNNEINYNNDIDELISSASSIMCEQLYHDIQEGGML